MVSLRTDWIEAEWVGSRSTLARWWLAWLTRGGRSSGRQVGASELHLVAPGAWLSAAGVWSRRTWVEGACTSARRGRSSEGWRWVVRAYIVLAQGRLTWGLAWAGAGLLGCARLEPGSLGRDEGGVVQSWCEDGRRQ